MALLTHSSPVALWQQIVHEAEAACDTPLQDELESYLVFLLNRYINRPEMAKQILATTLLAALQSRPKSREVALQGVGDTCLLFSGLFPDQAKKRHVKISYFIALGRGSYMAISKKSNDLYDLLAQQFVSIMDILQTIHDHNHSFLMPLDAYDLWNEAGSQRALKMLKKYSVSTPVLTHFTEKNSCIIKIKK